MVKSILKYTAGLSLLFSIISCSKNPKIILDQDIMSIPQGFPAMNFPVGNEFTQERWALGKRLFYDPILSKSNKISCATCHLPQNAFSDTIAFSFGDSNRKGTSNAPSLTNIGYHPYFTRAGGVPTLEMQILVPIQEHNEFNSNIIDIAEELKQDSTYVAQIKNAYNREPDPFVITRAIANFERSFISGHSKFDQYINPADKNIFTASEIRGYELFNSTKTNCSGCHNGFNFTNYTFENNGLKINYLDSGRMRLTKLESDRARFKVPSLRNIALTGPFMHDGSLATLEAVVAHYNSGGKASPNKSKLIQPLQLTIQEQNDLVAFLKTLTDQNFINNKKLRLQ